MSCEHLICAHCAGPVAQGRCSACRAARSDLHHHGVGPVPYALALLLLAVAVIVAVHQFAR